MKIVLSAYNFYPTHRGGTEVYTRALAKYFIQQGHQVLIIAAFDKGMETAPDCVLWLANENMMVVQYTYEGLQIAGVELKNQTVDDIYAAINPAWTEGWVQLLNKMGWADTSQLYMNGFTTVSGLSLCSALIQLHPAIRISVIVHTPFICPKADMIYAKTGTRCNVVMTNSTCASCLLAAQTGIPYSLSRAVTYLLNLAFLSKLSAATPARLRNLVQKKFDAFQWLDKKIQAWVVFSEDMKTFMCHQSFISANKVMVLRHGIDKNVFSEGAQKAGGPVLFLYAGRFEEIKGVKVLAEAWKKIADEPDVRKLYLAGNWNESNTGKVVADLLRNRKDVAFISTLSQTDLAMKYRKVHCVIIPSQWVETGPMVFHEAVACGCDIISSDIGGQGELVNVYKDKAISFHSGDTDSLHQAIINYKPTHKKGGYTAMSTAEHFNKLAAGSIQ
jgi:glycosyltransferase involved in cell wall biosynthesis